MWASVLHVIAFESVAFPSSPRCASGENDSSGRVRVCSVINSPPEILCILFIYDAMTTK